MRLITKRSFPAVWRPTRQPSPRDRVVFDKGFIREFGLVGAWVLNQDAPRDLSGNGYHAAPIGGSFGPVAGPRGGFTNFGGNNNSDRLDLGSLTQDDPLSLAGLSHATFCWRSFIPAGGLSNAFPRVIDKSNGGSAANGYAIWYTVSTGNFEIVIDSLNGPEAVTAATRNVWETWAVRMDGGGALAQVDFFLNGANDGSQTDSTNNSFPLTTTAAAIGNWNHSTDRAWDGGLEYVYAFSQALPDAEVARIAREPYRYLVPEPARALIFLPSAVDPSATSAQVLPKLTQSGSGSGTQNNLGAQDLPPLTQDASAAQEMTATAVQTLASVTQAGDGAHGVAPPTVTADAALAINLATNEVYYTKDATGAYRGYSLIKMLTAYILLQEKPTLTDLDQTTTIEAGDAEGGTGNNLLTGDVISLYNLLVNLIVPSSNVSAQAIARVIGQEFLDAESGGAGDPYDRFLTEMGTAATTLGLSDTTYNSPSGMGSNQTNTAEDWEIVFDALDGNSIIEDIWDLSSADVEVEDRGGSPTTIAVTSGISDALEWPGVTGGKGGINGAGTQVNLMVLWNSPNGTTVAIILLYSTSTANRQADFEAIVEQLPVDFPELGPAGGQTLPKLAQAGVAEQPMTATAAQTLAATTQSGNATHTEAVGSGPNGVNFDGTNDYLTRGGDLTGAADSKQVTGAFWIKFANASALGTEMIFNSKSSQSSQPRFEITRSSLDGSISIAGYNSSNTLILGITSSAISDTDWHHVMFSFDLANASNRHLYVDDASDLSVLFYTDDAIDLSPSGTADHWFGARNIITPTFFLDACVADFWLDFGTYIDLSVESNRRKFVGLNANLSVNLGSDGSIPTATAPIVFLSGDTSGWHTNKGSGGGFTEEGALTDCADDPPGFNVDGDGDQTLPKLAQEGQGLTPEPVDITGTQTLNAPAQAGQGAQEMIATSAQALPGLTQDALAGHEAFATSAQVLPFLTQRGLGPGAGGDAATKTGGFTRNVGKMIR